MAFQSFKINNKFFVNTRSRNSTRNRLIKDGGQRSFLCWSILTFVDPWRWHQPLVSGISHFKKYVAVFFKSNVADEFKKFKIIVKKPLDQIMEVNYTLEKSLTFVLKTTHKSSTPQHTLHNKYGMVERPILLWRWHSPC